MYKLFAVTLLVAMLIPVDSSADPISPEYQPIEVIDEIEPVIECTDCQCCDCEQNPPRKRPVAKAVKSLRIRKFIGKLIGVKR